MSVLTESREADEALRRDMMVASKQLGINWGDGDAQFLNALVKELEATRNRCDALAEGKQLEDERELPDDVGLWYRHGRMAALVFKDTYLSGSTVKTALVAIQLRESGHICGPHVTVEVLPRGNWTR